jgi:predicted HTH transcriptional regulator
MRTLGEATTKHGLPVPKYAFDGVYLNLAIYRDAEAVVRALSPAMLDKLSKSERSGWKWLATRQTTTSTEYAWAQRLAYRTARHHLRSFQELGLLERVGSARATKYKVRGP